MGLIEGVLIWLAKSLVTSEALDWCPSLAKFLVTSITKRLPVPLQDRMREEWLADIESTPGRVSKLVVAIGIMRAAYIIGHEHRFPSVPIFIPPLIRFFDFVFALIFLVIVTPAFMFVGFILWIKTGRRAFFDSHPFVGMDGRRFMVRSLHLDASVSPDRVLVGIAFTPIYANVLLGHLSFVGPQIPYESNLRRVGNPKIGQYCRSRPGIGPPRRLANDDFWPYGKCRQEFKDVIEWWSQDHWYWDQLSLRLYFWSIGSAFELAAAEMRRDQVKGRLFLLKKVWRLFKEL